MTLTTLSCCTLPSSFALALSFLPTAKTVVVSHTISVKSSVNRECVPRLSQCLKKVHGETMQNVTVFIGFSDTVLWWGNIGSATFSWNGWNFKPANVKWVFKGKPKGYLLQVKNTHKQQKKEMCCTRDKGPTKPHVSSLMRHSLTLRSAGRRSISDVYTKRRAAFFGVKAFSTGGH